MKLNTIKEMMRAGDLREAEAALREYLKADAGSTRAKVLLGVCLHLQGDEEGASRIDRQLADGGETCAAVGKFHALKVAASCAMMVLAATAGAASDNPLEGVDLGDVPGIGEPLKPMYGISVELPVKIVFDAGGGMGTMPGKSFSGQGRGLSVLYVAAVRLQEAREPVRRLVGEQRDRRGGWPTRLPNWNPDRSEPVCAEVADDFT